ncbi:uncharacterized protein LOC107048452 [Diachasma alloeum]|uniref:uncharacterized protein LOC107048452 n=1 Tax=Diachasma alloeum TaxID=454923 RepID=UPI00073831B5|nr:uncharacterized protein LOC107048452 [Diachasma alloeum]
MEDFNEGVDGKLASRMRKVNPEQFLTLVKMHLSFELDITTDDNDPVTEKTKDKKWGFLSFSKKPKSLMNLQQKGESTALTNEGINQVKQLMEYLSKEQCIVQEGIFRRTGKLTRQQDLKTALYQGHPIDLNDGPYSVHDCASVLKSFLAELPEPLLTELHYPAHCQIAELCSSDSSSNESRLLGSLQLLLLLLPPTNRILLKHLLKLLHKTASFESSNKMNCDTLATLFTPHLMCPRKLSPEALHVNSQNLSGLVAFMIRKGKELFEIPPKLATDIRAYWVDQERRLLSPNKNDLNESISDATGTAHTVFSFVDHKLTAKANSTEDTQAALAQLYAHIQAMPESAKKRRLVKQFNKENGQGTPRHVKQVRTKSLGDSIKKHIFQKKLLGHKKLVEINIGFNMSKSSSEENILSSTHKELALPSKTLFSKSDDELSSESFTIDNDNLMHSKHMSSSTGSLDKTNNSRTTKTKWKDFVKMREAPDDAESDKTSNERLESSIKASRSLTTISENGKTEELSEIRVVVDDRKVRRYNSEPCDMHSNFEVESEQSEANSTDPIISTLQRPKIELVFTPKNSELKGPSAGEKGPGSRTSPVVKYKFWNCHSAHTSTPADILRRNLANGEACGVTPIKKNDKSMSPITKSTAKMPRSMQETMMTPRSRKPVMMISGSNLCNLAAMDEAPQNLQIVDIDIDDHSYVSSPENASRTQLESYHENKENYQRPPYRGRNFVTSIEDDHAHHKSTMSITSTFREYLLSRSVLTASPVDLSFTSRTGDFEQSESDLNILNEEGLSDSLLHCLDGNNPGSDTSGIASSSGNSGNNSDDKFEDGSTTGPRKRGTSLQRNDSKRSVRGVQRDERRHQSAMQKQLSESTLNSIKLKDTFQETSF